MCLNLAKQIVVDGEGAKKFVTVNVINAKSLGSAKILLFQLPTLLYLRQLLLEKTLIGEELLWGLVNQEN